MRRFAALFTLLSCAAAAQPERRSPGYAAYEKANALFAAGAMQESSRLVEEALARDARLVPALTLKAKLAMSVKDHKTALEALRKAVEVAPAAWYARFMLGFQYYLQNELHAAIPELETAARLNPAESKPVLYLGLTHESLGSMEKAVECYRRAIRMDEAAGKLEPETLLILARLQSLLGDREECAALIETAIKLDPGYRDSHYERARLLLKQGELAGAAQSAERALALRSGGTTDGQIRYLLVRVYGLLGDERRAAAHAAALRTEEAAARK